MVSTRRYIPHHRHLPQEESSCSCGVLQDLTHDVKAFALSRKTWEKFVESVLRSFSKLLARLRPWGPCEFKKEKLE